MFILPFFPSSTTSSSSSSSFFASKKNICMQKTMFQNSTYIVQQVKQTAFGSKCSQLYPRVSTVLTMLVLVPNPLVWNPHCVLNNFFRRYITECQREWKWRISTIVRMHFLEILDEWRFNSSFMLWEFGQKYWVRFNGANVWNPSSGWN
jgi:hypothetical protein